MPRRRGYYSDWGEYYTPATPIEVKDGIKARSKRGKFTETWWADRWIRILESFGWENRLQRGRSYARRGQVVDYKLEPGLVTAKVQGTQRRPYSVQIEIEPLSPEEWNKVADVMASQAVFAAKLLSGEMPQDIEDAFSAAGFSLFPESSGDIETDCSCPDWANPCKHIAAVYYLLGEEFDQDPFMIFHLRGKTREEIMDILREKRSSKLTEETERETPSEVDRSEEVAPLEDLLDSFWDAGDKLDNFRVSVSPPEVHGANLRRLGRPPFWDGDDDIMELLDSWYRTVSEAAIKVAFGEGEVPEGG